MELLDPTAVNRLNAKGVRERVFSLVLKSPSEDGFPASPLLSAEGSNAVQEWWERKAALDSAPFLQATHSTPRIPLSPQAGSAVEKPQVEKGH